MNKAAQVTDLSRFHFLFCRRRFLELALVMVHHPVGAFDRILYAAEHRIEARIADRHVRQVLVLFAPRLQRVKNADR